MNKNFTYDQVLDLRELVTYKLRPGNVLDAISSETVRGRRDAYYAAHRVIDCMCVYSTDPVVAITTRVDTLIEASSAKYPEYCLALVAATTENIKLIRASLAA